MIRKLLPLLIVSLLFLTLALPAFAQDVENVTITVRCQPDQSLNAMHRCTTFETFVDELNAQLEAEGDPRRVTLELISDPAGGWGPYKQEFVLASEAGQAPDIINLGHEDVGIYSTAGYIMPLDDQIFDETGEFAYPELANIIPGLWESASYDGQIWGVPTDSEARPLFYSKPLVRQLGWTDEEIDSLPERIESGEFTWDDVIATAQEAIEAGVVEPGHGLWHRPVAGVDFLYYYYGFGGELENEEGQLVFDTNAAEKAFELFHRLTQETSVLRTDLLGTEWSIWHETVSSADSVLFWPGGIWNWGEWENAYGPAAQGGGREWLAENIGYALIPAFEEGGTPITLTHPLVYSISTQAEHPDLAIRLIAGVMTPERRGAAVLQSGHLGNLVNMDEYEPYATDPYVGSLTYMLDYTTFISNSPYYSAWSNAFFEGISAVESGDLVPEEAVAFVVQRLQNELGENVIIE